MEVNGVDAFVLRMYKKATLYLPSPNVASVPPHSMCLLRFFVGALAAQYSISQLLSSGAPEVLFHQNNPHFYFTSSMFAFLLPTAYADGFANAATSDMVFRSVCYCRAFTAAVFSVGISPFWTALGYFTGFVFCCVHER